MCSRCQALHTECGYDVEEGESRWSALRRRNRTLERERDEARDLIAQMQSRPEPEAQDIYHRLRTETHASDLGAFTHESTSAIIDGILKQQPQPQQTQKDPQHRRSHQNLHLQQQLNQQSQEQQEQQLTQRQTLPKPPHQQDLSAFLQPGYTITESTNQLPPLRSIVEVPTAGNNTTQQQLPQPFPPTRYRKMSQVSAMSSGSYSSLSSSEGHSRQSLSPKTNQPPGWAHGHNN